MISGGGGNVISIAACDDERAVLYMISAMILAFLEGKIRNCAKYSISSHFFIRKREVEGEGKVCYAILQRK